MGSLPSERGHQFVVNDAHDLLARAQALVYPGADRANPDTLEETLDDLHVDVRLEQRQANLSESGGDIGIREPPLWPEAAQTRCQGAR